MLLSACGLLCDECHFFNDACQGCFSLQGKPFWTKEATTSGICPIYDCSINDREYKDCGDCDELPCKIFLDLKDPNITEEEHKESIEKRVSVLKNKS